MLSDAPDSSQDEIGTQQQTHALARFAADLVYDGIPPQVVAHAETCVLDALGCGIYASVLPWCRIVDELATERGATGTATIWGTSLTAAADAAALANATSAHGFELDDIHPGGVHPGPVAVAPALALAEELGRSGSDVITSIVAGYEVGCRVAVAMLGGHAKAGFHAQGTVGTFVAVATAGRMLGLSADKMNHAFAIAGSMAAGLLVAQTGGMTKRLHSGRAAQNGVHAALLAGKGFTGVPDVLENRFGGFCKAMGGGAEDLSALTRGLGTVWETTRVGFKIYPSCGGAHSALHAARQLRRDESLTPEEISRVTVQASSHAVMKVGAPYVPNGVAGAQMNLAFNLALMLRFGEIPLDQLSEEGIRAPETLDLASRIETRADPEIDAQGSAARHASRVRIEVADGRVLEQYVAHRPGSERMPVTRADVEDKFQSLASQRLPAEQATKIRDAVFVLHDTVDVRCLTSLLSTAKS
jgi:2-methylcitrate dehydratase PrpD